VFIVIIQVPMPGQAAFDQPSKTDPMLGVAVSTTDVPLPNEAEQATPQSIPPGEEFTVPEPDPFFWTSIVTNCVKVAATDRAASTVTMHAPVPGHPLSDQPSKTDPKTGTAVNVTEAPLTKKAEQVVPQLTPDGSEVIVPAPDPALVMASVYICVNVAVTDLAAFMVTVHEALVPEQSPDQLEKTDPASGVAINVTDTLLAYEAEQVAPQLIPLGVEVTVPVPDPALLMVSVNTWGGIGVNIAVTDLVVSMVTVQGPVPVQTPPDQPKKTVSAAGVAVNVTDVPLAYEAEQVAPQLIPLGVEVTVPDPNPTLVTVSAYIRLSAASSGKASSLSLTPSPSVSTLSGLVPSAASSASVRPSLSSSVSVLSPMPSPSVSLPTEK
jgi:hypothetical protein